MTTVVLFFERISINLDGEVWIVHGQNVGVCEPHMVTELSPFSSMFDRLLSISTTILLALEKKLSNVC